MDVISVSNHDTVSEHDGAEDGIIVGETEGVLDGMEVVGDTEGDALGDGVGLLDGLELGWTLG